MSMEEIVAPSDTRRFRVGDWPEAYGIAVGVVGYLIALAVFRPPWSVTQSPSKPFRLVETILQAIVVATLIVGARMNRAEAPNELKRFWLWMFLAYCAAGVSTIATMALFQIAPVDYDRPGVLLSTQVYALFALAALTVLVAFGFLTAALVSRVRARASRGRSRAIFLDATAGALSMATIGALVFTRLAQQATRPGLFITVFMVPLGLIYTALLVMALTLVALARTRGLAREPEFCISVAMMLAVLAAANFTYQSLNPDSTPKIVSVSYWMMIAGGFINISERRAWNRMQPAVELGAQPLGATGPVALAFALPVVVVVASGFGMRGAGVIIAAVGTAAVGAIVLFRLLITVRENARLFERLEAERERAEGFAREASIQAEVASALLDRSTRSQEDERIELALRLHDEFLQGLSAIHMRLRTAMRKYQDDTEKSRELLAKGVDALESQVAGIRELMTLLRPTALEELGIGAAIAQILEGCEAAGIDTEFEAPSDLHLDPEIELALYRISQEAIANSLTHSGTGSIQVEIKSESRRVELAITDSGSGFEERPEIELLQAGKVGIASMRRRAEMAGIELQVTSQPGQGATVAAAVALT